MSEESQPTEPKPEEVPSSEPSGDTSSDSQQESTAGAGESTTEEQLAPEHRELRSSDLVSQPEQEEKELKRGVRLPIILFLATCLSTFWVGAAKYHPVEQMVSTTVMWRTIQNNWQEGLTYMGAVLAILLTHEMGHFLLTIRHRIPASYPLCIPVPINPIGTMGAVISMDGMKADRKQIFDIGLAGPLAGLVVAIPILWIGVGQLEFTNQVPRVNEVQLNSPLIVTWMIEAQHPELEDKSKADWIAISQVNPWFMAGWVGMLITGLNMMPISQLDGGHTLYGLYGPQGKVYARAFIMAAIAYVVMFIDQAAIWTPMLILVILMGVHHPPTADDEVELDDFRWILGFASLSIPILCFPLLGIKQ